MDQKDEWEGLEGIRLSIRECEKNGKWSVEYSYSIYSIKKCTAKKIGDSKTGHWGVENSVHWVLDIAFLVVKYFNQGINISIISGCSS